MKTLKFFHKLVPLIESGEKTTTFRFFDDKDLQVGDIVDLFVTETMDQFGVMTIREVTVKTVGTLTESDWQGHERYASEDEMYAQFRQFYGDGIGPDTEVKVVRFTFEPKRYKKIVVVDEGDNIIGAEYMRIAVEKGLIRRASRIYVFNKSGKLLVQQRSAKVAKPLMLDASAAGHVDEGETYEETAKRELYEELGLHDIPLTLVAESFRTPDFFNNVYKAVIPDDTNIVFDPEELAQIMWYDPVVLTAEMKENPELFTVSIKTVWSELKDTLVQAW